MGRSAGAGASLATRRLGTAKLQGSRVNQGAVRGDDVEENGLSEHWFISGANRGIGLELARQLSARGDRLSASVRNAAAARALNAQLAPQHAMARTLLFDVRNEAAIEAAAAAIEAPLDVLVANAGAAGPPRQSALDLDFTAALDLFSTNTLGPLRLLKALRPKLGGPNPRVVFMSSQLGSMASLKPSSMIYCATKAALNKLAQCAAVELQPLGVTVIAIHPGWVRTDMGGPDAPLSTPDSASGLITTIDALTIDNTGSFLDWRGRAIPW
jgi:NAD(P)-dependent dehydrogenase (short-subunit alcohol dehydrogenase family)